MSGDHAISSFSAGLNDLKKDFYYGVSVYYLHSWTADGPISRHEFATYMRLQEQKVTDYVNALHTRAAVELGEKISLKGNQTAYYIFNPLNWQRSEIVEIPIKTNTKSIKDLSTNKKVPCEVINRNGETILHFMANDIPSVGYKVYALYDSKKDNEESEHFAFKNNQVETPLYRIKLTNSGVITSMVDKNTGKEWAEEYLNYLGSGDKHAGEEIGIEYKGDNCLRLVCHSDEPVLHKSRFTFYKDDPRIDIENTIFENFGEPLYWTFSVNVNEPEVWHEEVGAIIKAKKASSGGYYANRMARYDHLTLNHFVDIGNEQEGLTISNSDCLFFRLGESTPEFLDENSSVINILIGGQIDKGLGIIDQDGDSIFTRRSYFEKSPHNGTGFHPSSIRFKILRYRFAFRGTDR